MKTLDQVAVGQSATILKTHADGTTKGEMMALGLTKSTPVTVCNIAPLGDPIEINVRGNVLSIPKANALMIEIE